MQPEIEISVFAKQGDVVLASPTGFIDKKEDQPVDWNVWEG